MEGTVCWFTCIKINGYKKKKKKIHQVPILYYFIFLLNCCWIFYRHGNKGTGMPGYTTGQTNSPHVLLFNLLSASPCLWYTFPSALTINKIHPQSGTFVNSRGSGRADGGKAGASVGSLTHFPSPYRRRRAGCMGHVCVHVCVWVCVRVYLGVWVRRQTAVAVLPRSIF